MAIIYKFDSTADDSDKSFTVPVGRTWRLDWGHITYVSTATVGNRQINIGIYDNNNVLRGDFSAGTVQAASLTRHYSLHQGIFRETSFVDGEIQIAIPINMILLSEWYIRVRDSAAVAAAADDMTVNIQVTEHSLGTE